MVGDGEAAIKMFHVKHFVTEKNFRFTENIGQVLQTKGINFSGKGGRKRKENIGGGLGGTVGRPRLARPYGQNEVLIESWRLSKNIMRHTEKMLMGILLTKKFCCFAGNGK